MIIQNTNDKNFVLTIKESKWTNSNNNTPLCTGEPNQVVIHIGAAYFMPFANCDAL